MGEFFAGIGEALSAVGTAIWNGISAVGSWIGENIITPVTEFVSKIPQYISDGFEWVQKTVGDLFGGNTEAVAEQANRVGGSNAIVLKETGRLGAYNSGALEGVDGFMVSAPGSTISTPSQLGSVGASAGAGGGLGAGAGYVGGGMMDSVSGAVDTGTFSKITDFFKTDIGTFVGKGVQTAASYYFQNQQAKQQTKTVLKAQEAEARRQEQEARDKWLREEQRKSEVTQWEAQRANQTARAQQQNAWAGFSGKWVEPTTAVPSPHF